MKVLVLTISDRASKKIYEDKSGPAIENIIKESIPQAETKCLIVSDEPDEIRTTFNSYTHMDVIITTGGTGIGPRDNTPDITQEFCDRLVPGISEYLRYESCKETINATLSRGVAGIKNNTIIINFPGSLKGAMFCAQCIIPILQHAMKMLHGEGH